MADKKKKRSFTLSAEADLLMTAVAQKFGISKAAVVEIAVRKYAECSEVVVTDNKPQRLP